MEEDLSYQVELIERVKKELGMSQSDISQQFEIGESAVSKWVKKKGKIPTGTRIALELMLERREDKKTIDLVKTLFNTFSKMTDK